MTLKIGEVLEKLSDGEWHSLEEIRKKMNLSRNQIQQVAGFLKQYEFVTVDETEKRMRIQEAVRKFLVKEATS